MSNIRFLYDNKLDIATLAESSQVSTLPVENLQNPLRTKVWRTTSNLRQWVEVDLGAEYLIKAVALINHNFYESGSLGIRLLGSSMSGIAAWKGWAGAFYDWMFQDGTDRGSGECNLTLVNSPTFGWNTNYGLHINLVSSSSQYAYCATSTHLNMGTGNFTLVARIKTSDTNTQGVIGKAGSGTSYGFVKMATGKMRLILNDGTNSINVESNTSVHDGAEHTVGVVVDRTETNKAYFYLDGDPDGEASIATITGSLDNDGQFVVGKWSENYFNGSIALVVVYKAKKMSDWDMGQIHLQPIVREDLTYDDEIIIKNFTGGDYQYWRLEFNNPDNPDNYIDIGRLFLGDYFEPSRQFARGWEEMLVDPSRIEQSEQGQEWVDPKEKYRMVRVEFPEGAPLSEADRESYREMLQAVGCSKDLFIALDYDNKPNLWSLYGKFAQTEFNFREFLAGLYTTGFEFKESR